MVGQWGPDSYTPKIKRSSVFVTFVFVTACGGKKITFFFFLRGSRNSWSSPILPSPCVELSHFDAVFCYTHTHTGTHPCVIQESTPPPPPPVSSSSSSSSTSIPFSPLFYSFCSSSLLFLLQLFLSLLLLFLLPSLPPSTSLVYLLLFLLPAVKTPWSQREALRSEVLAV